MTEELVVQAAPAPVPSERDQEIFRRIALEGHDLEEVARQQQLSASHVRRIVRVTERALALRALEHDPPWVRQMHLHRLEHQWQEAMTAWYRSQHGVQRTKVQRKGEQGEPIVESVTQHASGDVRYLEYAREVLSEIRRLGGVPDVNEQGVIYESVEELTFEQRAAQFDRLLETLRQRARADAVDRAGDGAGAGALSVG